MKFRESVLSTMNPKVQGDDQIINAALGLASEAGEFAQGIRKWKFQEKPFDREYFIQELGDIFYYAELAANYLNITREEIEQKNTEKLKKRYPAGFQG